MKKKELIRALLISAPAVAALSLVVALTASWLCDTDDLGYLFGKASGIAILFLLAYVFTITLFGREPYSAAVTSSACIGILVSRLFFATNGCFVFLLVAAFLVWVMRLKLYEAHHLHRYEKGVIRARTTFIIFLANAVISGAIFSLVVWAVS